MAHEICKFFLIHRSKFAERWFMLVPSKEKLLIYMIAVQQSGEVHKEIHVPQCHLL